MGKIGKTGVLNFITALEGETQYSEERGAMFLRTKYTADPWTENEKPQVSPISRPEGFSIQKENILLERCPRTGQYHCSRSRRRAVNGSKCMYLDYTHGLFIT
jgi:hypothetical protein